MLSILKDICERHNIYFWLDYGTLLGAIRHQGFIPWDTEADIGILRSHFERLTKIILSELPKDILFQTKETDPPFFQCSSYIEAKLRDRYSNYEGFEKNNPDCKWHNGIQVDIFVYDTILLNDQNVLMNSFERTLTGGRSYFRYSEIEEIEESAFEDTTFYVPIGYDAYLKRNYADYMKPPPLHQRMGEYANVFQPCNHPGALFWKTIDNENTSNL